MQTKQQAWGSEQPGPALSAAHLPAWRLEPRPGREKGEEKREEAAHRQTQDMTLLVPVQISAAAGTRIWAQVH